MNFQAYLKLRGKWREVLRYINQAGVPYVVELAVDTSRSPIAAAAELDDLAPEAIVVGHVGNFDWLVMFADALGVKRIVMRPPPTLEDIGAIFQKAVEYGIEINWTYGTPPLARIKDVETVARAIKPTAARIVYDPVKSSGTKEIYKTLISLAGYIREVYLSNRVGERGPRLPPFDPIGRINYVEILQALLLIQWEGRLTVRHGPQYAPELSLQLRIASETLETARSAGISRKVQRRVSAIYNELMGEGGAT